MTFDAWNRADAALRSLEGKICQSASAGVEDLTTLSLRFGDEVSATRSSVSGKIVRLFTYAVLTSCAWRLDMADIVLFSHADEKPKGGTVRSTLDQLRGRTVSAVDFREPAGDLSIRFESGQRVHIFCCVPEGACGGDYFFIDDTLGQKISFQVGPHGAIDFDWPKEIGS